MFSLIGKSDATAVIQGLRMTVGSCVLSTSTALPARSVRSASVSVSPRLHTAHFNPHDGLHLASSGLMAVPKCLSLPLSRCSS